MASRMVMPAAQTIKIMIVEDQEMVRLGLKFALAGSPGIDVVSAVGDGNSAIAEASEKLPDVVLLDIGLPDISGIEVAKRLKAANTNIRLIMFTSHTDDESVFAAMAAGADGYCEKDTSCTDLVAAICTVHQGAIWLAPAIAKRVLRGCAVSTSGSLNASSNNPFLSARELQILSLIVQELSAAQIASRLNIERSAVISEIHNVVTKLSNSDRARIALAGFLESSNQDTKPLVFRCPKCGSTSATTGTSCPKDGEKLVLSSDPLVGKEFAERYDITEQLGFGGTSIVYKARHKFMNNDVAIKILHAKLMPDLTSMKRFRQEAQVTSLFNHPNIVNAFDFGITPEGQVFLIMSYLEGPSLAKVIKDDGSIPLPRAINIFMQLCDALDYAHKKDVVHRDLKPANIILTVQDGLELVKVVDFGIAKLVAGKNSALTQAGQVFGSPVYMSPEQCSDDPLDARSDIYSFGCVMFECLTGLPPFCGSTASETIRLQMFETAPAMSECTDRQIPAKLEELIGKCLQKNPNDRPQTILQLKADLAKYTANPTSIR